MADGRLQDATREFMAAAMGGSTDGMYNCGVMLLRGQGVRNNIPEAARWFEKAAAAPVPPLPYENVGIAEAMNSLGTFYNGGIHYKKNKIRAREYWESSAELGLSQAMSRERAIFYTKAQSCSITKACPVLRIFMRVSRIRDCSQMGRNCVQIRHDVRSRSARELRELAKTHKPAVDYDTDMIIDVPSEKSEEPVTRSDEIVPSLEQLRAIDTPFGRRQVSAREKAMTITRVDLPVPEMLETVVQLAAEVYRIEDSHLVFTSQEMHLVSNAAKFMLKSGVQLTAELALCQVISDPSFVSFWMSMQIQFPNDLVVTRNAARASMRADNAMANMDTAARFYCKASSLLPYPDDDSDPTTLGVLYDAGAACFLTKQHSLARELLTWFLKQAPADGHPKAGEAHFVLGLILLDHARGSGLTKKSKSKLEKLETQVLTHLHESIALQERLPTFIRETRASTFRTSLEEFLRFTMTGTSTPAVVSSSKTTVSVKRGGELVSGPRRHPKLRSNTSTLCAPWRKTLAKYAEKRESLQSVKAKSAAPLRSTSIGVLAKPSLPATIDELFSALKDHVYKGRSLECLVISSPIFTGSWFEILIEDSQREPAHVALNDAPPSLLEKLAPGQALILLDPYVRIASDGSIVLRADDPSASIQLKTKHSICWACSVEEQPGQRLRSCAKCNQAPYCSQTCQKQDWSIYGHRSVCVTLKKR